MKVNAVSFNHTRHYNIQEADKPYIKEIRTVYAYNPESATHLCELTPSYDLRYLHTYIVFNNENIEKDMWESQADRLTDQLEERYCHEDSEDTYMHVSDVRQFAKDNPLHHKECGEYDSIEDACEHLNGNWPF